MSEIRLFPKEATPMHIDESQLQAFVAELISTDGAHDLAHVQRVVANAKRYATTEQADLAVVIPAAWLHDCVSIPKSWPDRSRASSLAANKAAERLLAWGYPRATIDGIHHAIVAHSYSAGIEARTLEAKIVQDADRIDALGAIGISRCLLVGGNINRSLYSAIDPFCETRQPDDGEYCIDHFFSKLFGIAETLHTDAARQDAKERVGFMRQFLARLAAEISV